MVAIILWTLVTYRSVYSKCALCPLKGAEDKARVVPRIKHELEPEHGHISYIPVHMSANITKIDHKPVYVWSGHDQSDQWRI